MVKLFVPRTALACTCGEEFVFPARLACPRCGEVVQLLTDLHHDTISGVGGAVSAVPAASQQTSAAPGPARKGIIPDEGARWAVVFGVILCASMVAAATWFPGFIHLLLDRAEMDGPLAFMTVRWVLVLVGLWGLAKGLLSLATWSSGPRVYRRWRF